jgi:hypothetical protein
MDPDSGLDLEATMDLGAGPLNLSDGQQAFIAVNDLP